MTSADELPPPDPSPDPSGDASESAADVGSDTERLLPLVYEELRRLAARRMREERGGHTLDPTALVHEAYLRLAQSGSAAFRDREHVLATAARAIRRVLVDHARARGAERRGGDARRVTLATAHAGVTTATHDLLELDEALQRLEAASPRHAEVVQLRWFAGLDVKETAKALGVSPATVKSDWRAARAFLKHWLGTPPGDDA